jgi:hypothetical protein
MSDYENLALAAAAAKKRKLEAEFPDTPGGVSTNSEAVDQFGGKMRAMKEGFENGATFGFVDEAFGAGQAALGKMPGGQPFDYEGTFSDRYAANRDDMRARHSQSRDQNAAAYGTGNVLGGTAQGLAGVPMATGSGLLGTVGRGALLGSGEGALYGAGNANGQDVAGQTVQGAVLGGITGAMAPAVVAGGGAVKDILSGGLDSVLNRGNVSRANQAVSNSVRESGKSVDEIASAVSRAQMEGQPMYATVDAMGQAGQRRLSGLTRSGGDASQEIAEYLQQRTIDAPDRMIDFTDDAFGMNRKTRQATEAEVRKNRGDVADSLYDQAAKDAGPVDVRGVVSILDDTIAKMDNSGITPPDVVREYKSLRAQLAGQTPDGNPTTLSDYNSVLALWRQVRDQVDAAYTPGSGQGHIGEALKPVQNALKQSLENSSDLFTTANDLYRRGSEVVDAFETGAQAAKRGGRADDNIAAFNAMRDQQKRAARVGYGDETIKRIEGINAEAPNVSRQVASTKRQRESAAMAIDPDLYARQVAREGDMYKTFNRALGGSKTADNVQDMADVGTIADLSRAGSSAISGNAGGMMGNLVSAAAPYLKGQNEATRKLIAEALMSDNPRLVLGKAVQQGMVSDNIRRALEAFIRSGSRTATSGP